MYTIEPSPLGRIVVPDELPAGFALFYTTSDFDGRLDHGIERQIAAVVSARFLIDSTLTTCNQVHGTAVQTATAERKWRECDSCDALWSSERGVALGIKVADCLPVTLVDPQRRVFANIHSGWRGAVQRITSTTLDTVLQNSAFAPISASAYLGPSIRACCFEVGEEVAEQFPAAYVDRGHAKPHVDLPALTADLLVERGFAPGRIFDSGLCTRCEGSIFHSFRREGKGKGRNLAIAAQ